MSSFTFTSTANAFLLRGAKPIFCEIREDTLNIDETQIEAPITERTKAIVPMHYAGVGCEMDAIMEIGSSILKPYNRSNPKVYITAIQVDDDENNPTATVVWSRKLVNDVTSDYLAPGTAATIPTKLVTPGSFLIRVSSELDYSPVITWSAADTPAWGVAAIFDGIKMAEIYYLRPRMSNTIPCADCNS